METGVERSPSSFATRVPVPPEYEIKGKTNLRWPRSQFAAIVFCRHFSRAHLCGYEWRCQFALAKLFVQHATA